MQSTFNSFYRHGDIHADIKRVYDYGTNWTLGLLWRAKGGSHHGACFRQALVVVVGELCLECDSQ